MTLTSYRETLAYIYSYTDLQKKKQPHYVEPHYDLARMEVLLERVGNPHRAFPSLLVAGTKGKGSTVAFAEHMLRAAGYETGLYTSPHLHTFRERIRVTGQMLSEEDVIRLTRTLKPHLAAIEGLTAFEIITAIAFCAFAEARVDIAVLEVGLGGRLDATNVTDPAVAVITPISYDHTQLLGDTLALIAREKAGIIRPGALVISAPQVPEAMTMIEEVCAGRRAELIVVGEEEYLWRPLRTTLREQAFELEGERYSIPLLGRHQLANAVTALAALDGLERRTGLAVPLAARREGLAHTRWPGRLEILGWRPYVVVDSAHNGDSASKLRVALQEFFPGHPVSLIFGASGDHPFADSLRELLPIADRVWVTQAHHPRAALPETLAQTAADLGYQATPSPDVATALAAALAQAGPDDLVCVTGSIFTVADAREACFRREGLPLPPLDPPV
jgi:dihydrofolate synthase/folylpolyglutamate synthase